MWDLPTRCSKVDFQPFLSVFRPTQTSLDGVEGDNDQHECCQECCEKNEFNYDIFPLAAIFGTPHISPH